MQEWSAGSVGKIFNSLKHSFHFCFTCYEGAINFRLVIYQNPPLPVKLVQYVYITVYITLYISMLIHHNWLPSKLNFAKINTKEIRKTTALLKKKN